MPPPAAARIDIGPASYRQARGLVDALGVSETVALTLVRRGYGDAEAARAFLEAADRHDPFEIDGMDPVCDLVGRRIAEGAQITVHGDYDADGVCSTALLVGALRSLGAAVDWFIPDRAEGYGLSVATIDELAARGTRLLITVDCGINSVAEVARARELGMDVVITDHHKPGPELPDCPILHPSIGGYPCEWLCGTGVAWKLATALRMRAGRPEQESKDELDLVALATVADVVPLVGENRTIVREGLAVIRRARRPGIRALLAASRLESAAVDEGAIAFRLAPRINAVGRLRRADAGVELMLCADSDRAGAIADELDRANAERRSVERELRSKAERALAELEPADREGAAIVLAGEDWHAGVLGITASRLAGDLLRPVVMLSIEGERCRGSARSVPGYDLVEGLASCSGLLTRFGGHAAAAGLEIETARIPAFRTALAAHAESVLGSGERVRLERVDAVVGGEGLGLGLAEELDRLGPFGAGNPPVRLLVPAATLDDVRPMGEEGRHVRFLVRSGSGRARGVGFGTSTLYVPEGGSCDLAVDLEANEWNGAVEPRVVLRALIPREGEDPEPACALAPEPEEWWTRFSLELSGELPAPGAEIAPGTGTARRTLVDRPNGSAISSIVSLLSCGEPVVAVCADAARRAPLASLVDPGRFGIGSAAVMCGRCSDTTDLDGAAFCLIDWRVVSRRPDLLTSATHVLLVDPPPSAELERAVLGGAGYLHRVYGPAEQEFAVAALGSDWDLTTVLRTIYAALRDAGGTLSDEALRSALGGGGRFPRTPEQAARCTRVLVESQACSQFVAGARSLSLLSAGKRVELESSAAYLAYTTVFQEGTRYLSRARQ